MDPKKIQGVLDRETPRTCKQLQNFLRFANFYHPFISNFAKVALPMMDLLKTKGRGNNAKLLGAVLDWSPECDAAFSHLKTLFMSEPVLGHLDETQKFIIQVDTIWWQERHRGT